MIGHLLIFWFKICLITKKSSRWVSCHVIFLTFIRSFFCLKWESCRKSLESVCRNNSSVEILVLRSWQQRFHQEGSWMKELILWRSLWNFNLVITINLLKPWLLLLRCSLFSSSIQSGLTSQLLQLLRENLDISVQLILLNSLYLLIDDHLISLRNCALLVLN